MNIIETIKAEIERRMKEYDGKTCNIGDHRPTKFNIDGYLAYVDKVKSWLKSLRPSWKPSEEQMKTLLNIEGDLRAFQYNDKAKIIAELYEQLKRL